jgi:hypothetical protein
VQVIVLCDDDRVSVQKVSPLPVCRERDVQVLRHIGEVQHHHESLQPPVFGIAPAVINDHLPLLIDAVALRREIVPVPVVVVRIEVRGAETFVLQSEIHEKSVTILQCLADCITELCPAEWT